VQEITVLVFVKKNVFIDNIMFCASLCVSSSWSGRIVSCWHLSLPLRVVERYQVICTSH